MTFIVATNVIASLPPEHQPTGMSHARAKISVYPCTGPCRKRSVIHSPSPWASRKISGNSRKISVTPSPSPGPRRKRSEPISPHPWCRSRSAVSPFPNPGKNAMVSRSVGAILLFFACDAGKFCVIHQNRWLTFEECVEILLTQCPQLLNQTLHLKIWT